MATTGTALHLFDAVGIEVEYMLVDRNTLAVAPVCDRLIEALAGETLNEVDRGPLALSNELALHVAELKTNGPVPGFAGLARQFHSELTALDAVLEPMGAALLPGPMHPLMDPFTETRLWPHGQDTIYQAYNRIFDCRGHGWSNLQSIHVNLPFQGDAEFAALHAAIRLALPLLPALAAASPIADGRAQGRMDQRMEVYRHNAARIPQITGLVVPEHVADIASYHSTVFAPMFAAIAPHDPDAVLQEEWLNSRGAIARFDRDAIEIRVLDSQECPDQDLAVAGAAVALVRGLLADNKARQRTLTASAALSTERLAALFLASCRDGDQVAITDGDWLQALGLPGAASTGADSWRTLLGRHLPLLGAAAADELRPALALITDRGCLARRLLAAAGGAAAVDAASCTGLLQQLRQCLLTNRPLGAR